MSVEVGFAPRLFNHSTDPSGSLNSDEVALNVPKAHSASSLIFIKATNNFLENERVWEESEILGEMTDRVNTDSWELALGLNA
jgi:hypothetical protein